MDFEPALAQKALRNCAKLRVNESFLCLIVFAVSTASICFSIPSINSDPWFQEMRYLAIKSGDFGLIFREWQQFLRGDLEMIGLYGGIFGLLFVAFLINDSIQIFSAKYNLFKAFERNDNRFTDGNKEASLLEILFPSGSLLVLKLRDGNDFDLFELSSLLEAPDTVNQAIELAVKQHPEKSKIRSLTTRINWRGDEH